MQEQTNISIFISSTFNDMQSERDYIRKYVVPRLVEHLAQYNIAIQIKDLRWGVNTVDTNEEERESKVLHVCLDTIRQSRPFFIALLGGRYGWIPTKHRVDAIFQRVNEQEKKLLGNISEKSVTELEILFGAIGDAEVLPHSLFLFRDEESYNGMSKDSQMLYRDSVHEEEEMQNKAQKLQSLKEHITEVCYRNGYQENLLHYKTKWNEEEQSFSQFEEFGEILYQALKREILEEIKTTVSTEQKTEYDIEKELLERYISNHVQGFKGRKELLALFENFLCRNVSVAEVLEQKYGYFLSGFSGCGKSALFSSLYHRLEMRKEEEGLIILAHSAGISPKSVTAEKMIARWTHELGKVLDEENSYTNTDDFKNLLLRTQSKGYKPVILIDSLDNFSKTSAIKNFDFIPYNVPFICTTLPHYANVLLKAEDRYGQIDVDSFSYEDATEVIKGIMKENSKELPDNLINKLLSIKTATGEPAYQSPLWLRMSLSILMEIGEEDFKEIHKEQFKKEEEKIEVYLQRLIESFPGDAVWQFQYLLDLTYHYFNASLSKEVLTYIALSRFGMDESSLAELTGDKWNPLDFTSVCYWLRYFLNKNYDGKKWNFSHNKLKETLLIQDSTFLEHCKTQLLNYLKNKANESKEDKEEFIYQVVLNKQYDVFMEYLQDEDSYGVETIFTHRILIEVEEKALQFIDNYLDQFYKEDYNEWLVNTIEELMNEGEKNRFSEKSAKALLLGDMLIGKFTEEDCLGGNVFLLNEFFMAHRIKLDFYDYNDMFNEYEELFLSLKRIYLKNKQIHGSTILTSRLLNSLFDYWRYYVRLLCRRLRYSDHIENYLKEMEEYFGQVEELCSCNRYSHSISNTFKYVSGQLVGRLKIMPNELAKKYFIRMCNAMSILTPKEPGYSLDTFACDLHGLIEEYKMLFDNECEDIEIIQLIKQNNYKLGKTDFYSLLNPKPEELESPEKKSLYSPESIDERTVGTVSCFNLEDDDMEGWEEIDFDEEENDEEILTDEDMSVPSPQEIQMAELALDKYLKLNTLEKVSDENFNEVLDTYYSNFKNLATLHQRNGATQRAKQLMDTIGTLLLRTVFSIGDNYAMGEDDTKNFIDLSNWYAKWGMQHQQRTLLEPVCDNLLHSFLHHLDGEAQLYIFNKLIELYKKEGLTEKRLAFETQLFETAFLAHLTKPFDSTYLKYNDLSYVRPLFIRLFNSLKETGEIKQAVVACEKWMKLCNIVYTDSKDTGSGYEDIDETYDRLAGLYDGTPALLEGMAERNSIFLQEKCILVCLNKKWGYISHNGEEIISCIYERGWKESEGILSVRLNGKWGYINLSGKQIIPCVLDVAIPFSQGYARIKSNNKWGILTPKGTIIDIVTPCEEYCEIKDGLMKVRVDADYYWNTDFMKLDGKTILFDGKFSIVYSVNQNVIVAGFYKDSDPIMSIFDTNGNPIVPMEYDSIAPFGDQNLAVFRKNDKYGYINRNGIEVIPPIYSAGRPMYSGIAAVAKTGFNFSSDQWGFVNENGKEILEIKYNDVGDFHDNRAWVCLGERGARYGFKKLKFGFIDTSGNLVIPMIYDDVTSFHNGQALVFAKGERFYIDTNGSPIQK